MTKQIDTVVFDLGGVLVDWNPRHLYRKILNDEKEVEHFLAHVCNGEWNEQQDAGRPLVEATAERIEKFPQHEPLIRAFYGRWTEMMVGQIDGTVRILETLRQRGRHKIFALSNWSAETFPLARSQFGFFELFDAILLSGEEKLIKPDPRFFNLLSERHGVVPHKSVFIDDVEKNINGACALGFNAIRFTDPDSLRQSLTQYGVL